MKNLTKKYWKKTHENKGKHEEARKEAKRVCTGKKKQRANK